MSDSDSETGVPLIDPEFDTVAASEKRSSRKRKADEDIDDVDSTRKAKKLAKKEKRKQNKKLRAKEINDDDLDQKLGVNHAFEKMDSQLLADYINSRTRLYGKDLSSVELEEKLLPGMSQILNIEDIGANCDKAVLSETPAISMTQELRITWRSF